MPERSKNIVICSDGTGQSYAATESNVLQLYRLAAKRSPRQIACYDPGVGTLPAADGHTRVGRMLRRGAEVWLGLGVIDKVTALYAYLMRNYESGDRIFLFGFSRGAFTVRALAGMIHVCGLLRRDDEHLLPYVAGLYQTSERRIAAERRSRALLPRFTSGAAPIDHATLDAEADRFKALFAQKDCHIAFMGIWDTVKAYGWLWPQSFPALRHNPSIRQIRHAVSLDERRSAFQMTGWGDRHLGVTEVWFNGDHSDVGGGHPGENPLSNITLAWMLGEATCAGLLLDARGRRAADGIVTKSRSAVHSEHHDLRRGWFTVLDWLPRFELDNRQYPPRRLPRAWPTGKRDPWEHTERAQLLFHDSVRMSGRGVDEPHPPCAANSESADGSRLGAPAFTYALDQRMPDSAFETSDAEAEGIV